MSVKRVWCSFICSDSHFFTKLILLFWNATQGGVIRKRVEKKMSVERKMTEVLNYFWFRSRLARIYKLSVRYEMT